MFLIISIVYIKIFITQSSDIDILVNNITNLSYKFKANTYYKTTLVYHLNNTKYIDIVILLYNLTFDPDLNIFVKKQLFD